MQTLETVIYELFENFKRNVLSAPLYLGGISASGGGAGGPAGGFVGKLPQTQVTYDFSEEATNYTPSSGYTLVDNLNHIRYRIQELEDGSSVIMQGTDIISSGVLILKFDEGFEITPITSGVMISIASGVLASGVTNLADSQYVQHVYNEVISSTGTSHSTAKEFIPNSLRIYLNGVRQDSTQFTENGNCHGFETVYSVPAGYKLEVEYAYVEYGDGSSAVSSLEIQKNGTIVNSGITVINFEGDNVSVTATPSGVTVVFSGAVASGTITDHTELTSIGTNTHDQIDSALSRLATTSGNNSGDQDLSNYITEAPEDNEQYVRKNAEWVVISGITTSGVITSHLGLSDIGTNTHAQIDTALTRLATTSGNNSGDQDLSDYLTDAPSDDDTYGRKNGSWVTVSGGGGGIEEAPIDGNAYNRQDAAWVVASGVTVSGLSDAPSDGTLYGRQDGEWTEVTVSGGGSTTISGLSDVLISGALVDGNVLAYDSSSSMWSPYLTVLSMIKPPIKPVLTDFTWRNQETATAEDTNGGIYLFAPAATGDDFRVLERDLPNGSSGSYVITALVIPQMYTANYNQTGIALIDSATGKLVTFSLKTSNASLGSSDTTVNTFAASNFGIDITSYPFGLWLRFRDDGTTRYFQWSINGYNYFTVFSEGRTTYCTPDKWGIIANSNNATRDAGIYLLSYEEESL